MEKKNSGRKKNKGKEPAQKEQQQQQQQLVLYRASHIVCMSWNILHQKRVKIEELAWEHRLPLINMRIKQIPYSVICLQEVDLPSAMDSFGHFEKLYHIVANTQGERHKSEIGCLSMFLKEDWKILKVVDISCGILTFVRIRGTKNSFWICNVHLNSAKQETRVNLIESVLGRVACSHLHGKQKYPVVICGDFNERVKCGRAMHKLLAANKMDLKNTSPPSCYVRNGYRRFDKAYGWRITVEYFDRIEMEEELVQKKTPIPNNFEPSDHIPVEFFIQI